MLVGKRIERRKRLRMVRSGVGKALLRGLRVDGGSREAGGVMRLLNFIECKG